MRIALATALLALLAAPAQAALMSVSAGCAPGGVGPVSGSAPVSLDGVCFTKDLGVAHAGAIASFGHLGARADAASVNGNSLFIANSAEAHFTDSLFFSDPTAPIGATTQVSVNLLLDGFLNAAAGDSGNSAARTEGFVSLGGTPFFFTYFAASDGTRSSSNGLIAEGSVFGPGGRVTMTSPMVTVFLNSPTAFNLSLQTSAVASGPASSSFSEFESASFKLPTGRDAFNLADGVTVNAGDYLVNNRFIDPLAAPGGVPEPASWTLMILGFGLAGAAVRRRRSLLQA
jgi:hypothetical protein